MCFCESRFCFCERCDHTDIFFVFCFRTIVRTALTSTFFLFCFLRNPRFFFFARVCGLNEHLSFLRNPRWCFSKYVTITSVSVLDAIPEVCSAKDKDVARRVLRCCCCCEFETIFLRMTIEIIWLLPAWRCFLAEKVTDYELLLLIFERGGYEGPF